MCAILINSYDWNSSESEGKRSKPTPLRLWLLFCFQIDRDNIKKEQLLFYMRENWTLPRTFAQIVHCMEDSSSLMELNYGKYQNLSKMNTFRDEFPVELAITITAADLIVKKLVETILPIILLFVAAIGADNIGRLQMTIYVCSLLFGLGCFCCNQTYVGYIWACGIWFFESKTSELLCEIILLETTTWHHRYADSCSFRLAGKIPVTLL